MVLTLKRCRQEDQDVEGHIVLQRKFWALPILKTGHHYHYQLSLVDISKTGIGESSDDTCCGKISI